MLNSNQLRNHTFEKFLFEIPEYATVINYSRRLKTYYYHSIHCCFSLIISSYDNCINLAKTKSNSGSI